MVGLCRFYYGLFIVAYIVYFTPRCFAYYGSDIRNIIDKLQTVDEKIEILNNEVNRLADATAALTNSEKSLVGPVTLVAFTRSPTSDGNVFTVHFKKNEEEIFINIYINEYMSYGLEPDSQDEGADGISSITFSCNQECTHAQAVTVFFSNTSESSSLKLKLDNTGSRAMFQDQFTVPTLEILHSGDLVYTPESDVQVKISSSYSGDGDNRYNSVSSSLRVVDLDSGSFFMDRGGEEWIQHTKQKRFLHTEETTLVVKTSEHSVTGFLDVSVTFADTGTPLLRFIEVLRSTVLRPFGQEGPFPPDFVEFKHERDLAMDGRVEKICRIGSSCVYACSALGTSITALDIRLEVDNNETEPVDTTYDSESTFDYSRTVKWKVEPTAESEDLMFQCIVQTANRSLTKETNVLIQSDEFYIDTNNSYVQIQLDEANTGYGNVSFVCIVVGRPLFEMAYFVSDGRELFYPIHMDAEIIRNNDHAVATATIQIYPTWNPMDGITQVKCRARGYGQHASHVFHMPTILTHPSESEHSQP